MRKVGENIKDKRLRFKKGMQKKFIRGIKIKSGLTWRELAEKINVSEYTLRVEWQKEKSTLPYNFCIKFLKKYPFKKWKEIKSSWIEEIFPKNWGQKLAGESNKKIINSPEKSEKLAELLGVILGDGHLERKTLTITGNFYEKFHHNYLSKIIKDLFGLDSIIFKPNNNKNVIILRVYSIELIKYLRENGMVLGNKIINKASLPRWIFKKEEFIFGALRGLFDTDGGIYFKQKKYKRALIEFQTRSTRIREDIITMLKKCGFNPSKSSTHGGYPNQRRGENIRVQNQEEIHKFFRLVGSSNPKNIIRYDHFLKEGQIPLKEKLNKEIINLTIEQPFKAALV